ncbi:DUF349 domain-containing protein [Goekera deserti]|uniref:DUF349 domain-containing protein n=1 Tax=Goekera deserti TaxID=2497753 RepID=UPI001F466E41|nr:DUF349 domain-containing protein [Goekera deserti]
MSSTENNADRAQQTRDPEVPEQAPPAVTPEAVAPQAPGVGGAGAAPTGAPEGSAPQVEVSTAVTQDAGTPAAPAPADAVLADPTAPGPAQDTGLLTTDADPSAAAAGAGAPARVPATAPADTPAAEIDGAGLDVADAPTAPVAAPTTDPATDPTAPVDPAAAADPVVPDAAASTPGRAVPRGRGRRGPGRAPAPAPVVPSAPPSDPTLWGRVDEDGTVYVRTAQGERSVGSWQAGEPAEGLAHYGRRYDDLATEVLLLEARLGAHQGNPNELKAKAQALVDGLPTATAVGDLDSLMARAEAIIAVADDAVAANKAEKAAARTAAIARKEALAAEAEQIGAESTQWKASGDRLKAIVEEWKTIKGIDRKTDEALWTRFAAARDAFGRRRGAHFAALDVARGESRAAKKELIAEAERLSTSTEWGPTSAAMRALMDRWKAVPRTGRDTDDDLWKQFRAAQDVFFAARTAQDKQRDTEHQANQQAKEAVLAEAEALDPSNKGAQNTLRQLQERYDAIGHVPRESMRALEDRMQAVEEKFRGTADTARARVVPENPMLTQMRAAVAKAEDQLAKAQAAGNAKRITEAEGALATRREWLAEAEKAAGSRR